MNHQQIGDKVRKRYDETHSKKYREQYDVLDIESESRQRNCDMLGRTCLSFENRITVLDLGCGSGRYLSCLQNVERLIGLDISIHMLKQVRTPVDREKIDIPRIDLVCANFLEIALPHESFDFIYSIGVLGEHSPFDEDICDKLYDLLKPGGKLFLTVADRASKSKWIHVKKHAARFLYPLLPTAYRDKCEGRWDMFFMTAEELTNALSSSRFSEHATLRHVSTSTWWKGAHFDVTATRESIDQ